MIKLGMMLGYSGKRIEIPMDAVRHAESLGIDSVWIAEAYGSDAISPAAWILAQTSKIRVGTAIMQMPARSPAMAAMTAMTLAQLSGNRFIVGLGASGPQVIEGWHGVPYGKPITRMREYIQIMRLIMERKGPVEFDGKVYQLPLSGEGTSGLGKPLKSILEATPDIPIYTAQFTPAGLACAAEVADGTFPVWMAPEKFELLGEHLETGFAKTGGARSLANFDVAPTVHVVLGDDVDECRNRVRESLALYIGGMGARAKNFYNDYAVRMGYEGEAKAIQDLYLSGKKAEAEAAVPNALIDEVALVGPRERIIDRAQLWKECAAKGQIGTMLLASRQPEAIELMAEIML